MESQMSILARLLEAQLASQQPQPLAVALSGDERRAFHNSFCVPSCNKLGIISYRDSLRRKSNRKNKKLPSVSLVLHFRLLRWCKCFVLWPPLPDLCVRIFVSMLPSCRR